MTPIRIIPAIVRAFFSSFAEGVVVGSMFSNDGHDALSETVTPQKMKQLMLEHYEEISKQLFNVCFNPFALVSYNDVSVLESILRKQDPESLTPQNMLQYACGGAEMCELMIEEYRRNFYSILAGKILTVEEFFDGIDVIATPAKMGNVSEERAIHALVLTIKGGFHAGRQAVNADDKPLNQIYIYRLLEDNMQCLMHDAPVHVDDEADLNETFTKVCGGMENMNIMIKYISD